MHITCRRVENVAPVVVVWPVQWKLEESARIAFFIVNCHKQSGKFPAQCCKIDPEKPHGQWSTNLCVYVCKLMKDLKPGTRV